MIHIEFDLEYSRVIKFLVLLNVAGIFFLAVSTPSSLDSKARGYKFILFLNKWSQCLPEFYYYGRDLIIGIFFLMEKFHGLFSRLLLRASAM